MKYLQPEFHTEIRDGTGAILYIIFELLSCEVEGSDNFHRVHDFKLVNFTIFIFA